MYIQKEKKTQKESKMTRL